MLDMKKESRVNEVMLTRRGQVTIPVAIRKSMKLKPRDRVVFTQLSNGTLVVRVKNKSVTDIFGILPKPRRKVRIEDMRFGKR
jgi:AbrB family looped-hinge helix DNA binding protein